MTDSVGATTSAYVSAQSTDAHGHIFLRNDPIGCERWLWPGQGATPSAAQIVAGFGGTADVGKSGHASQCAGRPPLRAFQARQT